MASSAASAGLRRIVEIARLIPKTELHVHLDGSLSARFIRNKCHELGLKFPVEASGTDDEVHNRLCQWIFDMKANPEKMRPFLPPHAEQVGMMGLFDWMNQFLQTESDLTTATLDVCEQLRKVNVCYAEIRFCPTLHTHKGLTEEQALVAVKNGFEQSRLDGGIIVCALRTFDAAHAMRMAKLAATGGAVGFDVAGYETGSPLSKIAPAIEFAVAQPNLGVTVHAGEWVDQGNEGNLQTALDLKVDRVGHALELIKDEELMAKYIEAGIHIEANPISNTKWLPNHDMSKHPVRPFFEAGLSVGLNSDNYLFSGTPQRWPSTAVAQVVAAKKDMGMSWASIKHMILDTITHAFCSSATKERIQAHIDTEFDRVLASVDGTTAADGDTAVATAAGTDADGDGANGGGGGGGGEAGVGSRAGGSADNVEAAE